MKRITAKEILNVLERGQINLIWALVEEHIGQEKTVSIKLRAEEGKQHITICDRWGTVLYDPHNLKVLGC